MAHEHCIDFSPSMCSFLCLQVEFQLSGPMCKPTSCLSPSFICAFEVSLMLALNTSSNNIKSCFSLPVIVSHFCLSLSYILSKDNAKNIARHSSVFVTGKTDLTCRARQAS